MRAFNFKKSVQALNFFAIKEGGSINKMKAIKLVWLSDRIHIRKYGRLITGDTYYALPNGPVPSATRDILESNNFIDDIASEYATRYLKIVEKYSYCSIADVEYKVFSLTDTDILKKVFDLYGDKSQYELSSYSHKFPEWKRHESSLSKRISSRFEISYDDFFTNVKEPCGIFDNDEYLSKEIFEDYLKITSLCQ
jgi:uncharacterized phage-associated protein